MSDNPLVDTIVDMNAASIDRLDTSLEGLLLIRLAALVAVDAPPASYLVTLGAGADSLLTLEDVRSVLIAVAPVVGAPRVVSAVRHIAEALGMAISLEELMTESGSEVA
jgi:alkylhydroperoxidase/carboxymuconolactone decarboxylase family protein YurZ